MVLVKWVLECYAPRCKAFIATGFTDSFSDVWPALDKAIVETGGCPIGEDHNEVFVTITGRLEPVQQIMASVPDEGRRHDNGG